MFARFQLKWWRTTGVWPRGAQVLRLSGSSETPDSPQNASTALRRRAFLPDPGPVIGDPGGDRLLVALHRATRGTLQAPVEPAAQDLPHVSGMVGDPGDLLDHLRDPRQGPDRGGKPVRHGALLQGLADSLQLCLRQPRDWPGRPGAAQRLQPSSTPAGMPAADNLLGDPQLTGDLSLGAARVEQRTSLEADPFERLAVTHTPGVATVRGWSHPAMLPGQARRSHRNGRGSLGSLVVGPTGWT